MSIHAVSEGTLERLEDYVRQAQRADDPGLYESLSRERLYEIGRIVDRSVKGNWYKLSNSTFEDGSEATQFFMGRGRRAVAAYNYKQIRRMSADEDMNPKIRRTFHRILLGCELEENSSSHLYIEEFLPADHQQGFQILPPEPNTPSDEGIWAGISEKARKLSSLLLLRRPDSWITRSLGLMRGNGPAISGFAQPTLELISDLKSVERKRQLYPFFALGTDGLQGSRINIWLELDRLHRLYVGQGVTKEEDFVRLVAVTLTAMPESELTPMQVNVAMSQALNEEVDIRHNRQLERDRFALDVSMRLVKILEKRNIHKDELYQFVYDFLLKLEERYGFQIPVEGDRNRVRMERGLARLLKSSFQLQSQEPAFLDAVLIEAIPAFLDKKLRHKGDIYAVISDLQPCILKPNLKKQLKPYMLDAAKAICQKEQDRLSPRIYPARILQAVAEDPLNAISEVVQALASAIMIEKRDKEKVDYHLEAATRDLRPMFDHDDELRRRISGRVSEVFESLLIIDLADLLTGDGQKLIFDQISEYGQQATNLADYLSRHPFELASLPANTQRIGLVAQQVVEAFHEVRKQARETEEGKQKYVEMKQGIATARKVLKWTPEWLVKLVNKFVPGLSSALYYILLAAIKDEKILEALQYVDEDLFKASSYIADDLIDRHELKRYLPLLEEMEKALDLSKEIDEAALVSGFCKAITAVVDEVGRSGVLTSALDELVVAMKKLSTADEVV